jgi:hypothetical protein
MTRERPFTTERLLVAFSPQGDNKGSPWLPGGSLGEGQEGPPSMVGIYTNIYQRPSIEKPAAVGGSLVEFFPVAFSLHFFQVAFSLVAPRCLPSGFFPGVAASLIALFPRPSVSRETGVAQTGSRRPCQTGSRRPYLDSPRQFPRAVRAISGSRRSSCNGGGVHPLCRPHSLPLHRCNCSPCHCTAAIAHLAIAPLQLLTLPLHRCNCSPCNRAAQCLAGIGARQRFGRREPLTRGHSFTTERLPVAFSAPVNLSFGKRASQRRPPLPRGFGPYPKSPNVAVLTGVPSLGVQPREGSGTGKALGVCPLAADGDRNAELSKADKSFADRRVTGDPSPPCSGSQCTGEAQ